MKPQCATAKPKRSNVADKRMLQSQSDESHHSVNEDYKVATSIVAGRILVTRAYGFASAKGIENYIDSILQFMADGLIQDQPYVHVMDWSEFNGGSLGARNKIIGFLQGQPRLKGVVLCGASSLMRMSVRVTKKLFTALPRIKFCPDLNNGLHLAGSMLGLSLPNDAERPSLLVEYNNQAEQHLWLGETPGTTGDNIHTMRLSNNLKLEFKKFGTRILFCQIKGLDGGGDASKIAKMLHKRHRAVLHCLDGHPQQVEIWDCSNFHSLFDKTSIDQFFKHLLDNDHPLLGCIILDTDHHIRMEAHRHSWVKSTAFPVRVATSLTAALLQAQACLLDADAAPHLVSPPAETHPEWIHDDGFFRVENQIINDRILHTHCCGTLSVQRAETGVALVRPLAEKVAKRCKAYYMIMGITALNGGSYRARKTFATALRQLYRDHPFQMYIFYGAKGTLLAGINLVRHKLPFRILIADDFQGALSAIEVDQYIGTHLATTGNQIMAALPRQAPKTLKHYADDILRYLGTINWEPYAKPSKVGPVDPNHPFAQVFGAIDLIKDDLAVLYAEQQKAAREQLELEAQLARSRKMEALGLMAGGVAHDLNNVLTGIVTYPDMLLMEVGDDSKLREPLGRIRDSGQKAAAIVKDLLTLARRGVNHATPLNINDLVEEYIGSPEHQALAARYPDIIVKTVQASDLMNIRGSAVHLKKTIMNLVYNAYEASGSDNTIELVTENRFVDQPFKGYDTVAIGDYAIIHVIDHGTGIAEADLPRIFEPFYTKKKMGRSGTGLGMAVVWGTIQDHKGYIDVQTIPGEGTTFSLYFPVSREKIAKKTVEQDRPTFSGHGELILVVDDDPDQRNIATAVLGILNYRVASVNSGEAALDYLKKNRVALVLLDMVMDPGIDGLETLKQIRSHHGNLPVIIATGYAEDDRIKKVRKLNGEQLIRKPYTVQPLSEALHVAMH